MSDSPLCLALVNTSYRTSSRLTTLSFGVGSGPTITIILLILFKETTSLSNLT